MYLVSVFEKDSVYEASLGGRVTADEIFVLAQEMTDTLEDLGDKPFTLLLDYSRAKHMDSKATLALHELKDLAFEYGVVQITSVTSDENVRAQHQTARLQNVLEGRERFVAPGYESNLGVIARQALKVA